VKEIPQDWAIARALQELNCCWEISFVIGRADYDSYSRAVLRFASYIQSKEEAPDRVLLASREALASVYNDPGTKKSILAGEWDQGSAIKPVRAGVLLGIEMAE
jgi:hypothetical protein